MSGVDRRRLLALLGTGTAAALAGCNRLFTRADPESTPEATPSPTPEETATPVNAPTTTPASVAASTVVSVPNYTLSLDYRAVHDVTVVDVELRISNVSGRSIRLVEIRVDLVYDPQDQNRVVAVDYVGARGIAEGDSETVSYETRFSNDDRMDRSADSDDFGLVFRVRGVDFT